MDESTPPSPSRRFYEKPLSILLMALGVLVLVFIIIVAVQVVYYYRKIQLGEINAQTQKSFSPSGNRALVAGSNEKLALSVEGAASFGLKEAKLRIIVFSDFECPYSKDAAMSARALMLQYPDKFYFVFRNFPLTEIHKNSFAAAEAGVCANKQGKFWPMHDKLFQNQDRLSIVDLKLYALQIGLDMVKFNQCFDNHLEKEKIEIDLADGQAAGLVGTPTFFINGVKIEGAIPKETMEKIIKGH